MIWILVFLTMFAALMCMVGLSTLAFPTEARRFLVWLADMTPGQLRFLGLVVCQAGLALLFAQLLFILFVDF